MQAIDIIIVIAFIIFSYLIGSIPFGIILGELINKKDIRNYGSKNIGTTNAIRVLGKKTGFLVFVCDMLKGIVIIRIVEFLEDLGIWSNPEQIDLIVYGFAAILGHCYSIYIGFKGGKAVATSLGVVLALSPLAGIFAILAFAIILITTGYVSLSSTAATIAVLLTNWILYTCGSVEITNFIEFLIAKPSTLRITLLSIIGLIIIIKHKTNYIRLINGTENSFKKKNN